ncbi:MAG: dTDP-4-dehydrorhamnose reductase [Solirubrobacteraceae bacterium]|jgi:dTDP-4-dehydrorhamnose reductase|nr:dTDP-4-dehydrorhamnose reductase [Solirubrobacteraceae bacterium]MCU0313510.1 dTDP-4-dehydrorhamnose reductase [Solirubrobacteraceae bacterium]
MRVLVTGAYGMLGREVVAASRDAGHDTEARDLDTLDISDRAALDEALADLDPDVVVNCAGWTDVDGAEEHEAQALHVNGTAPGVLAAATAAAGVRVVHVSTDYVFPGDASEPYVESSPTGPRSAYGRTKLAGEHAVAAANPDHVIARTAWLFGLHGKNFVDTMLALGAERETLRVVDDQTGCPTWAGHLAPALITLAEREATGLFHTAGGGSCTWFELAREALAATGSPCRVEPTTTDEFPRPAPRPAYSVLATERAADGVVLPPWREGLAGYLAERASFDSRTTAGGPR